MYVHTYIHVYIRIYVYTYVSYIHTNIHTNIHTYIHACMHTYIHIHIYTYIHMYMYLGALAHNYTVRPHAMCIIFIYLTKEHLPIITQSANMRRVGSDSRVQDSLGNATLVAARKKKKKRRGGKLNRQPQIYDTKSRWTAPLARAKKKIQ